MLHVLAEPGHHPQLAGWAGDVWAGLRPELAERLREAEFLWRSSRADFLVPARPRPTLAEELDDVDRIDDETYVTAALVTTCGSNRVHFAAPSPLADATARERALDLAQARGAVQEAFAERLLADPAAVRARVRHTLEQCAEAFFDAAWTGVAVQLATDLRLKNDLLKRQGIGAALASVSSAVTLAPDGDCIIVDKLQDKATAAHGTGVTFVPSVFGRPHLVAVHAPGWQPVVQYPVAEPSPSEPVSLETVTLRLEALAQSGPAAAAAHAGPRPAHHRRAGRRLGAFTPGGLPPPRRPAPRGPAHDPAARALRPLHPQPARSDGAGGRPAGGRTALSSSGASAGRRHRSGCLPDR